MTECQGCGAWNDTSRTHCVLCGTPLAEIDEWDAAAELPPLPPLPDGGLRASMPAWLREPPPPADEPTSLAPADPDIAPEQIADLAPLGPRADPRTFLSDDDFPQWLRDLAERREGTARRLAESTLEPTIPAAAARRTLSSWPDQSGSNASVIASATTAAQSKTAPPAEVLATPELDVAPGSNSGPDEPALAAADAARPSAERRGRDVWETLLLVLLFIGVIAAALWALIANGVFDLGL